MDEPELRSLLVRRLGTRHLIALDALVALAYTTVMAVVAVHDTGGDLVPLPLELLVVTLTGLPLSVRRVRPGAVFTLAVSMSLLARVLHLPGDAFVAAAFALYPVALTQPHRRWIPTSLIGAVCGLLLVAGPLAGPRDGEATEVGNALFGLALVGASWTLGRAVRERRMYASREARRLAERAVTEERLRIARELHDVVAHSMSLIAVKAGVAVHVAETRPQETLDALRVIENTSRNALTEMRHLLGVLRTTPSPPAAGPPTPALTSRDGTPPHADPATPLDASQPAGGSPVPFSDPPDARPSGLVDAGPSGSVDARPRVLAVHAASRDPAELAPVPGLAGVHGLVEAAAMAGVRADLRLHAGELPEGVALAVYRIVQEALTNIVKHAAPAHAQVLIEQDAGGVRIEVTDDGPGTRVLPGSTPGHGLVGMRERAMMYGGELTAGPRPEGGFAVTARLPYDRSVP